MFKLFSLLMLICCLAPVVSAQDTKAPDFRILPTDVVQDSIKKFTFGINGFAIRWTFTEAGARKILVFREAHDGEKITTSIGDYTTPAAIDTLYPIPPDTLTYAKWKEGWLKRRTDKILVRSEKDAQSVVAGLMLK